MEKHRRYILAQMDRVKLPVQRFVEGHFVAPSASALTKVIPGMGSKKNYASLEVTSTFFAYVLFAISFCLCVTVLSVVLSPKIFRKYWADVSKLDRKIWHTNMDTYFPAFFVTLFALPAILTFDGGDGTKFVHRASLDTVRACGLSLGYMAWDLAVMLEDPKGQQSTYGGKKAYYLFIVHHLFSLCIWPYAVLAGRCVYFVNFFLVSEVTNSNMSTRWFLLKCKLEKSTFYVVNGLAWIPLFLGVRVLVIPLMLKAFIFGSWNALSAGEKIVAFTTLPIPSMLNIYWARMIVSNAMKYLLTGKDPEDRSGSDDAAPMGNAKKTN
jgi:hypothetical protein